MNKVLFIVCTHGDEGYSIPVLRQILDKYDADEYGYDWIVGNPRALACAKRYTEADLNRNAPGDASSEIYELRRAAEIVELASVYECVIDIHGSNSNCGLTTLVPKPTTENLALAAQFPAEKHIVWYSQNSLERGPVAQHLPVPAIELECGYKTDPEIMDGLYTMLSTFLENRKKGEVTQDISQLPFFDVYGKIVRDESNADLKLIDFEEVTYEGETFLPYMAGSYQDKYVCYKLRKTTYDELVDKYRDI